MPKLRYQKSDIPDWAIDCPVRNCVYNNWWGECDNPRTNNGNGDAKCHQWSNKKLLETLGLLPVKL